VTKFIIGVHSTVKLTKCETLAKAKETNTIHLRTHRTHYLLSFALLSEDDFNSLRHSVSSFRLSVNWQ